MKSHLLIFVFHLLEYRVVSRPICEVLWTENSAAMGCELGSVGERLLSGYRPWVPPPVPQSQTSTHSQKSLQRRLRVLSAEFSSLSIGYLCKLPIRWPLVHQESPQPAGTGLPHPPSVLTHHCGLLMSAFKYQKFLTSLLGVTPGVTICTSVLDRPGHDEVPQAEPSRHFPGWEVVFSSVSTGSSLWFCSRHPLLTRTQVTLER